MVRQQGEDRSLEGQSKDKASRESLCRIQPRSCSFCHAFFTYSNIAVQSTEAKHQWRMISCGSKASAKIFLLQAFRLLQILFNHANSISSSSSGWLPTGDLIQGNQYLIREPVYDYVSNSVRFQLSFRVVGIVRPGKREQSLQISAGSLHIRQGAVSV
ncbi:hypothetical protein ACFX1S_023556 [Malus domestica]